ncbi:MAG: helix-turn-helix domain-containing protein [Acidobacteria bacterium]|nr:helix-turn-helix domain-containing protein [Acidobacteriota bacterium]MCA1640777.1 helix-turn-helix domain-containing protein [Acidobacteriota bacterium]
MVLNEAAVAGGQDNEVLLLIFAWCARCGRQERVLTVRQAAALCAVSPRTIHRWAADGKIHAVRMSEGALLVCYRSLIC